MSVLSRHHRAPGGPRSQRRHLAQPQRQGLYRRAFFEAFRKLDPRQVVRNPVMFVVWLGTVLTFLLVLDPGLFGSSNEPGARSFNALICLTLFLTVWFANAAEAIAEGRGKAQADALRATQTQTLARRLTAGGTVESVNSPELRKGDRVVVAAGEMIPADGEVIAGVASVDESAITGESAPVLKEAGSDVASSVTGGTRVISDQLTIQITSEPGKGFIDRMIQLVEGAKRSKTPNEIALTVLLAVLTQIFLIAIATLSPIATYLGSPTPVATLIALLVALIPTTIGGLLSAIGIAGMDRVAQFNVIATSGRAVEACGDINTLVLDKTGTITLGNRLADSFISLAGRSPADVARAAWIASYFDNTPEGKSIVRLAESQLGQLDFDWPSTTGIDFSARTRMSGTDTSDGQEFRKGAVDAIKGFARSRGGSIPADLDAAFEQISRLGGTPLAVCIDSEIYGVIYLKDIIKTGIRERFDQLRRMGIRTVMLTGDNHLTASVIAAEAGVDDFIAEATPEDKIAVIQAEQSQGKLVAMTGDGTNDAPALAQANVGLAMNSGTQAAKEAANMVDLDSDPTKLIDVVTIGKQLLITRGALTTFSIANDVAKYFAILPALFINAGLAPLNVMGLATPRSALLAAMLYNALIIPALIPLALKGVKFRPLTANELLQRNLLIYGLGGLIAPFLAIKAIDSVIVRSGIL
ncbi:potassium-transporting ATPase subunit KdpB [Synechococcus elongatus]|uniref:Potassium-transporting ATPase ATP-binding subunit n=2 Tax=Synechococcus elongatus TaxID=32046 RepID=Q31MM0_SYNE7|nr:potassium-transporting ATPase subunit KdpB [Synechococcus elongatus]ABB57699.1 Potassium-translocating P-type ATPase, B subunit [Synechococcus elongatus PCC 7942 = FACHB-805]AJD57810.1 potassium transporter TrkH [Synechococcus elongatus UTEX 2973]MBD2586414.1 potassium-transporting ATPase subunit KdpB [Synechococcus elongatus FACHB-242]MBD2687488.1 potassium-transporting ATPase subunit KdpB [Synechococcus elongatus FACHB-1061]MBD2706803.1 potassium-transporting ATPase subunit KdpB [Synechoc